MVFVMMAVWTNTVVPHFGHVTRRFFVRVNQS